MSSIELPAGTFYQPASLWSVAYVDTTVDAPRVRANFNRQHFRNGTRHPITLTRVALNGVNYPLDRANFATSEVISVANSGILNKALLGIYAPGRKRFSKQELNLSAYAPRPTGARSGMTPADSSLFGVNYLRFDKTLLIPRKSGFEFGVGSGALMRTDYPGWGEAQPSLTGDPDAPFLPGRIFVHEAGGMFSGSSRQKGIVVQPSSIEPIPDVYEGIPYTVPASTLQEFPPAGLANNLWPPQSQMNARDFEQQESTRSGSTSVIGMGVFIDQIDADDFTKGSFQTLQGIDPDGGAYKLAMKSSQIGCRVRLARNVTADWWWRPGAPICLVLDTITDALVYDLPEFITLGPGETLDVTMMLPAAGAAEDTGPGKLGAPMSRYQVGISFNGFTAIEG